MSLEICPVCKKPISGSLKKCPQCDSDLECYNLLELEEEREKKKTRFMKKTVFFLFGSILVIAILLLFLILNFRAQKISYDRFSDTLIKITQNRRENLPNSVPKLEDSIQIYSLKKYDTALELHYQRRFKEAIATFELLLQTDYPPLYKKNILYWLGLSHYGLNQYPQAKKYFSAVLENPGFENKDADALFMLGKISYYEKQYELSKQFFEKCLEQYPENSNREKIRKYLSRM